MEELAAREPAIEEAAAETPGGEATRGDLDAEPAEADGPQAGPENSPEGQGLGGGEETGNQLSDGSGADDGSLESILADMRKKGQQE